MLSERPDEAAVTAFFAQVIARNGWPDKIVHPLPGRALHSNVPSECITNSAIETWVPAFDTDAAFA